MKFSTRTLYGLRAILVLASRYGEGSLSVSQIAKKEGISVAYLEQILNALKKKNFVKSVRGPQGGYILTKKPGDIPLNTLLGILNGDKPSKSPATNGHAQQDEIALANLLFWHKFHSSIEIGLKSASLKDLVDEARQLKKSRSKNSPNFHI